MTGTVLLQYLLEPSTAAPQIPAGHIDALRFSQELRDAIDVAVWNLEHRRAEEWRELKALIARSA